MRQPRYDNSSFLITRTCVQFQPQLIHIRISTKKQLFTFLYNRLIFPNRLTQLTPYDTRYYTRAFFRFYKIFFYPFQSILIQTGIIVGNHIIYNEWKKYNLFSIQHLSMNQPSFLNNPFRI